MATRKASDSNLTGKKYNDASAGGSKIVDISDLPTLSSAVNVGTSRAYNNGAATVTMTAAATGGVPATYTVTSTPGSFTATGIPGIGGAGIGGKGSTSTFNNYTTGLNNTGSGGGGNGGNQNGSGSGGSGIVIIRYPASFAPARLTTGSPLTYKTGFYRVYVFNASGTITF